MEGWRDDLVYGGQEGRFGVWRAGGTVWCMEGWKGQFGVWRVGRDGFVYGGLEGRFLELLCGFTPEYEKNYTKRRTLRFERE
jgi:hypothetical protein